jgi:hypothetical protein
LATDKFAFNLNPGNLGEKTFGRLGRAVTTWVLFSFALAALGNQAAPGSGKPQDLTGMSLEALLHEEITPINVLGSHTHLKGGWMVGYRYMFTEMAHNLKGTREVSDAEVLQDYPVAHTRMTMEMHMAELMYAPSDWLTLMTMLPYQLMTMDHLTRSNTRPVAETSGVGDVSFMGLFNVFGNPRTKGQRIVLNAGFTAPTGSIEESMDGRRLEYAAQLGSGTWDLKPGLTYLGESDLLAWGGQILGTIRLGENDEDYRLGHGYRLSAWTQVKVTDWFGPSARLDWHAWSDVHGADPNMDPARNPAFDASKQSGARLDLLMGLNFYAPKGILKGNRLSIEGGVPLYQNIAGPNMGVNWLITAGWSYSFP